MPMPIGSPEMCAMLVCSSQMKRLSMIAVSTEASLAEARSKVEVLSRQLKAVQQQVEASEGLERDLKRLGQEAVEMNQRADNKLEEKQVRAQKSMGAAFDQIVRRVFFILSPCADSWVASVAQDACLVSAASFATSSKVKMYHRHDMNVRNARFQLAPHECCNHADVVVTMQKIYHTHTETLD